MLTNRNLITDFYEDCEVFVTGGSGSVGKALLEKLLRSCNVRCIYVLLRTKRNAGVEQRVEKLKEEKIFRTLRAQNPKALDKLIGIPGDISLPKLGITPDYAKQLENVSIFFHSAATVRFDEPLKVALKLNLGGTHEALKFAETLRKLKIFVHVSTFYSNPYLTHVEPKLYDAPMDWRLCVERLANDVDSDLLDVLTRKMIVGFPNTYCFTKNLAEQLVNSYCDRLPVIIYRPSIILQAASDPEPGFPPALAGAMGVFTLVGLGVLKTIFAKNSVKMDLMPQDFCTKTMIYFAMRGRQEYDKGNVENAPVYLVSSYIMFKDTIHQVFERMERFGLWDAYICEKSLLIPGCTLTENRIYYMLLVFLKQIPTALLSDFLLKCFGQRPAVMRIVRRSFCALDVMKPFLFNVYSSDGITLMEEFLSDTEGTEFSIKREVQEAKNDEELTKYFSYFAKMIRDVLLDEKPESLERSRKILQAKKALYEAMRFSVFYFACSRIQQRLLG